MLVSALRILRALARWRSDVVIFMILTNNTWIPITFIKIGEIDDVRPQRMEPP